MHTTHSYPSCPPDLTVGASPGWDMAWPEAFRALLRQGVEVVIVPTCWVFDDVGEVGRRHDPQYVVLVSF